jgi:hypothetical protein
LLKLKKLRKTDELAAKGMHDFSPIVKYLPLLADIFDRIGMYNPLQDKSLERKKPPSTVNCLQSFTADGWDVLFATGVIFSLH